MGVVADSYTLAEIPQPVEIVISINGQYYKAAADVAFHSQHNGDELSIVANSATVDIMSKYSNVGGCI